MHAASQSNEFPIAVFCWSHVPGDLKFLDQLQNLKIRSRFFDNLHAAFYSAAAFSHAIILLKAQNQTELNEIEKMSQKLLKKRGKDTHHIVVLKAGSEQEILKIVLKHARLLLEEKKTLEALASPVHENVVPEKSIHFQGRVYTLPRVTKTLPFPDGGQLSSHEKEILAVIMTQLVPVLESSGNPIAKLTEYLRANWTSQPVSPQFSRAIIGLTQSILKNRNKEKKRE